MLEGTFKDVRHFCFSHGVVFAAEHASSSIHFLDTEVKVLVKLGSLKFHTDLLSQLTCFSYHSMAQNPFYENYICKLRNSKFLQVYPSLEKPTSICAARQSVMCR